MRPKSKLANLCVSHAAQGLALFYGLYTYLSCLYLSGCQRQPGKGCRSLPGRNKRQKWTPDLYLRQFDAFPRQILASCSSFLSLIDGFSPLT